MTDDATPPPQVYTVTRDGARKPFVGTGVRVVVAPDAWVAIDFEFGRIAPVAVMIAGRSVRAADAPTLMIDVHAGNSSTAIAGLGLRPIAGDHEVVVVHEDNLKGSMLDWLRKTTSGDPVGETELQKEGRLRVDSCAFEVVYRERSTITVDFHRREDALLGVRVAVYPTASAKQGSRRKSLSMLINPHAANLISFWFLEADTFSPRVAP